MSEVFYSLLTKGDPSAVALRLPGTPRRDITFGALKERVDRLAGGLTAIGIQRGDVVGVWLPSTADWVAAFFAIARVGGTMLALNMRFNAFEIGNFVRRSKAKALFYVPDYRGKKAAPILEQIEPADLVSLRSLIAVGEGPAPHLPVTSHPLAELEKAAPFAGAGGQPGDRVLIMSSSGTTSQPKLITHTQERLVHHAGSVVNYFFGGVATDARVILIVPTCGAFGFMTSMLSIAGHVPMTMMENFEPTGAAELLVSDRITHAFGTNDQIEKILDVAPQGWAVPELRLFGHANFTPGLEALPQRAADRGVRMNGLYGMTEVMAMYSSQPRDAALERRALGGGLPLCPGAKCRVRSMETGELLPPGETGSLEVSTPDMMIEYLYDEEATRQTITEDGYLRTGDLAQMTSDGGFTFLSRINDILRIGGYLVNPMEIEEAIIAAAPEVQACQVVEVTAQGSVRPVAFVIGKSGYRHDEAPIMAACKARLAIYKVPIRVFQVDKFPITPSPNGDKVKKNVLRDMAKERIAATS